MTLEFLAGMSERWKRRSTLLACFLHVDVSFMLWVLFSIDAIRAAIRGQLPSSFAAASSSGMPGALR